MHSISRFTGRSPVRLLAIIPLLIAGVSYSETPTTAPTTAPTTNSQPSASTQPSIAVEPHFSPEEQIAPTIIKVIDGARQSLDIAAFAFTHPDISAAVIRAHQRGVRVRFVMDLVNENEKASLAPELIAAGIPLRVRHKRGSQHSKYLIVDQAVIVTGSFNFTTSADERNSENLLVIRNAPALVKAFGDDYEKLIADSVPKIR